MALTRWAFRDAHGALAHAHTVAAEVSELFSLPVVVTQHPPNIVMSPTSLPPTPPFRCLFVGMVRPYKGLDIGIAAVGVAREMGLDVRLTVAGEFWESLHGYEQQISDLGLSDAVTLQPGYATDAELRNLFSTHHVLMAPYRTASQSGVIPLAFAAGRPAVATDVGGISEVVDDGVNGLLARPDDPRSLARCLVEAEARLSDLAKAASTSSAS